MLLLQVKKQSGSAERADDPKEMRDQFMSISDGMYADLLFSTFGHDRVEKELDDFLGLDFVPRVGGGIGLTRMIRAQTEYAVRQIVANM